MSIRYGSLAGHTDSADEGAVYCFTFYSNPDVRKKIRAENINVVSPSSTDEAIGTNMD
ncbi:hypothetical protein KXV45_003916 [Aspergillus fumigatus]|nr:hypothetical protein KXV45_003916 [Aspergillus fumigatus]